MPGPPPGARYLENAYERNRHHPARRRRNRTDGQAPRFGRPRSPGAEFPEAIRQRLESLCRLERGQHPASAPLHARHADGASPATLKIDRAAVCKVHAVHQVENPGADSLVKDTTRTLAREGRERGRGQAQGIGWTAGAVRDVFRKRAQDVDAIAGKVSGHSFRVGSAQDLARDGASIAELQQAGGWKSAAMPGHYVRREAAARGPVARRRYGIGK